MCVMEGILCRCSILSRVRPKCEKIRSNELQVQLSVTSGKQNFFLKPKDHFVVLRVNDDGFIYFDDIEGHYKITDFQWEGPRYQTVTTTSGVTKYNEKAETQVSHRAMAVTNGLED